MILTSQFAYSQTRLQARHGKRPDEQTWRQLEAQQELANFLQNARRSPLRPWVLSMHTNDDWHLLEHTLLQQLHLYIEHVANWQPSSWRAAVRWARQLLYLPSLQYLLSGNTAPAWMLQDPHLKPFTSTDMNQRLLAMQQSDSAPVVNAWHDGYPLPEAWLQHWQQLWPDDHSASSRPLNKIGALLLRHIESFRHLHPYQGWQEREKLAKNLCILFRRYSQQPATAFLHLALVALDVERLRGNIMQRALFPELRGGQP